MLNISISVGFNQKIIFNDHVSFLLPELINLAKMRSIKRKNNLIDLI